MKIESKSNIPSYNHSITFNFSFFAVKNHLISLALCLAWASGSGCFNDSPAQPGCPRGVLRPAPASGLRGCILPGARRRGHQRARAHLSASSP
jgi:hypothetical protein